MVVSWALCMAYVRNMSSSLLYNGELIWINPPQVGLLLFQEDQCEHERKRKLSRSSFPPSL